MKPQRIQLPGWRFTVEHFDAAGSLLATYRAKNLILNTAKSFASDLCRGVTTSTPWKVLAVGSSGVAPAVTDTHLVSEVTRTVIPAAGTNTPGSKNIRVGSLVTIVVEFTGLTTTLREMGVAGDLSSPPGAADTGTFFNRVLIGPLGLTPGQTARVTGEFTFG